MKLAMAISQTNAGLVFNAQEIEVCDPYFRARRTRHPR